MRNRERLTPLQWCVLAAALVGTVISGVAVYSAVRGPRPARAGADPEMRWGRRAAETGDGDRL